MRRLRSAAAHAVDDLVATRFGGGDTADNLKAARQYTDRTPATRSLALAEVGGESCKLIIEWICEQKYDFDHEQQRRIITAIRSMSFFYLRTYLLFPAWRLPRAAGGTLGPRKTRGSLTPCRSAAPSQRAESDDRASPRPTATVTTTTTTDAALLAVSDLR